MHFWMELDGDWILGLEVRGLGLRGLGGGRNHHFISFISLFFSSKIAKTQFEKLSELIWKTIVKEIFETPWKVA